MSEFEIVSSTLSRSKGSDGNMKINIIGRPPTYCSNCDPRDRVFRNTMMKSAPLISVLPGAPKFLGGLRLLDFTKDTQAVEEEQKRPGESDKSVVEFLKESVGSSRDLRYYAFDAMWYEYYSYVNTMATELWVKMGFPDGGLTFDVQNGIRAHDDWIVKTPKRNGILMNSNALCYYLDYKGTQVSESNSNEYGASMLEGAIKTPSSMMREMNFLLGIDYTDVEMKNKMTGLSEEERRAISENMRRGQGLIGSTMQGIAGALDSMVGINGQGGVAQTIVTGSQFMFPEIWHDSRFSRSYTMAFKFQAPYGDNYSVFKYVYLPLLTLLGLALPRQESEISYMAPFLVKIDAPGWN